MATLAPTPVELYLRSDFEPDADFVDGEVELRPMGEYDHASWQQALQFWFGQNQKLWNIRVLPELRVQASLTRYRVPDVVVFDRNQPVEQILTHTPIAVFEVLSPEDTMTRILVKLDDYAAMGIQNIFVVNPKTELFYRFHDGILSPLRTLAEPLHGSSATLDMAAVAALRG